MNIPVCLQMSLNEKSDEEIGELLEEYGIKHGPIVGKKSTHTKCIFLHFANVITELTNTYLNCCRSLSENCNQKIKLF